MPPRLSRPLACVALALLLPAAPAALADMRPVASLSEMRRHNVVIQEWDLSCGAAALSTLLRYQHGLDVSEREVARSLMHRDEYLANPDVVRIRQGFSLLDMQRYVESRGLDGIGYGRLTLADLVARAPIIVPVDLLGYPHFVVFRGLVGDRVLLADPAWGNRTMTVARFERGWMAFPGLGKVGFVAARPDGQRADNRLAPRREDFVMLR